MNSILFRLNFETVDQYFQSQKNEEKFVTVPGRQGTYTLTESIHDKYETRPKGVENLTLSQFATCYTKCNKKPKNTTFNDLDVSDKKGLIRDHLSNQYLPQHIKMSNNEILGVNSLSVG